MSYNQYSYNGKEFLEVYDNRRPSQMNQFSSPYKKRIQNSLFCFFSKDINTSESSFTILGSIDLSIKEKSNTNTKIEVSGLDVNCAVSNIGDCTSNRTSDSTVLINVTGDDFSIFIENINDISTINLNIYDNYNIRYFSIMNTDEDVFIEKINTSKIINITKQEISGYGVFLNPPNSSALLGNRTIYPVIESNVQQIHYTQAYVEPQSFNVAVSVNNDPVIVYRDDIEGNGKLVVSSDSRFFNNSKWDSSWTSETEFNGNFKLFSNIIKYINDDNRVLNGNKKILVYQNVQNTFISSIVNTGASGYSNSLLECLQILGYTVDRKIYTVLPRENIGVVPGTTNRTGNSYVLNYDINKLNEYSAILIMSNGSEFLPRTLSPYIRDGYKVDKVFYDSLKEYMRTGGGVFVTGSNLLSDNDTFGKASVNQYNALVYPPDGVNASITASTDIHNLINTIITDYGIYVNGSITTNDVINVADANSNDGVNPITQGIPSTDIFEFLPRTSIINNESRTLGSISTSPTSVNIESLTNINYRFLRNDGSEGITKARYHKVESPIIRTNIQSVASTLLYPNNTLNTMLRQNRLDFSLVNNNVFDYITNGSLHINGFTIADFTVYLGELIVTQRTSYGLDVVLNGGDILNIRFFGPFNYSHSFILDKRTIENNAIYTVSDIYRISNNNEAITSNINLNDITNFIIQTINDPNIKQRNNFLYDVEVLRQYLANQIRLPKTLSLIYDDNEEYNQAILSVDGVSPQDIFNSWGIFNVSGSLSEFYENVSVSPNTEPFTTWIYDTNTDSVVQTANTATYTGFVSPEKISSYVHEVTLSSSSADDDAVGVCIAHLYNGTRNHTLDVIVSNGGVGYTSVMTVVVDRNSPTNIVVGQSSHDVVYKNGETGGNGWSGKRMRLRIERNGDNIKILATDWDSTEYNPSSEILINLNSRPELEKFKGPKSYGYTTVSQANSTYLDIDFSGGNNFDLVTNVNTNQNSIIILNERVEKIIPMQISHGFIKVVENPSTGRKFLITEDDHYNYWGNENSIEVVGKRKFIGQETFYIVNYNIDKSYTVVASGSTATITGDEININVQSNTGEYTFTVSDGVNDTEVDVVCLQPNQTSEISTGSNSKPKIPRTVLNKRK